MFKDKDEFKIVFNEYYNVLCNYAFSILNNHDLSEDVVQEVFLHFWKQRQNLNVDIDTISYLFTSVKNKSLEYIRKNNLEISKIRSLVNDQNHLTNSTDIHDDFQKYLQLEKMNKSIRQLPTKCRDIFVLSKVNGLTYSEIAELKEISKKTVENHISNALKFLRKTLKEE